METLIALLVAIIRFFAIILIFFILVQLHQIPTNFSLSYGKLQQNITSINDGQDSGFFSHFNSEEPTIAYFYQDLNGRHLKVCKVDLEAKELRPPLWHQSET